MSLSLYAIKTEYLEALEALSDPEFPPEAVRDTLEGMQGSLEQGIAAVAAYALNLQAEADSIGQHVFKLQQRKSALERKVDQIRKQIKVVMEMANLKKVKADDSTFDVTLIAARPSLVIDDYNAVPEQFRREEVEVIWDKDLIAKALKDGQDVPGARLEYKPGLRIG